MSENQILEKLEEKLPFTKTYLVIFEVVLSDPRVHLKEDTDRVTAGLDVMLNINLKNNPKSFSGTVDATSSVIYQSEEGAFYLSDPIIGNLEVLDLPEIYSDKAKKTLTKAIAFYYKQCPIYKLKTTDTKQAIAKVVLKDVNVENTELVITLGI